MENSSHDLPENEPHAKSKGKTISIRIPAPSLPSIQSLFIILLIIVGLIQTAQLYGLQKNIASAKINTTSASVGSGTAGSNSSALPTMVGGC
ncbi:MAG: hypothetical protein NUV81_03035 [bacterium]|nr:hypothetical protein [bacterium]